MEKGDPDDSGFEPIAGAQDRAGQGAENIVPGRQECVAVSEEKAERVNGKEGTRGRVPSFVGDQIMITAV